MLAGGPPAQSSALCYFCIIWFSALSLIPEVSLVCRWSLTCPWTIICPRGVLGPQSVLGLSFVPEVSLVCRWSLKWPWAIICPKGVLGVSFVPEVSLDYHLSPRWPWCVICPQGIQRVLGKSFIPNVSLDYHLSLLRRRLMVGCVFRRCRKNTMSLPRPAYQPQPSAGRVYSTRCSDFFFFYCIGISVDFYNCCVITALRFVTESRKTDTALQANTHPTVFFVKLCTMLVMVGQFSAGYD